MKNYFGISRDHSGSMHSIANAAMRDYNENIATIKSSAAEHEIDTIVSVVKCGAGRPAKVVREVVNSNVQMLKPPTNYLADGNSTPLFDSVGDLIDQLQAVPDADDPNVSFVVMVITDGEENSSVKWNAKMIGQRIRMLQATDRWTFVFRVPEGAKNVLESMGIPGGNILEWGQTERGMRDSSEATQSAVRSFYAARKSGQTSTSKFYADLSEVQVKDVKQTLVDVSGSTNVYPVHGEQEIKPYVEQMTGKPFIKGTAYYQLTKSEKVQDNKLFAIRDKMTGAIYSGVNARNLLGLPSVGEVRLAPASVSGQFDIFVQSNSVNRKLPDESYVLVMRA